MNESDENIEDENEENSENPSEDDTLDITDEDISEEASSEEVVEELEELSEEIDVEKISGDNDKELEDISEDISDDEITETELAPEIEDSGEKRELTWHEQVLEYKKDPLYWDEDEEEWVTIEISLNWFAICKKTNSVYYFGEWSRDCEDGFDASDVCTGEESNEGSWEAGKPPMDDPDGVIARPGLMMAGTKVETAHAN